MRTELRYHVHEAVARWRDMKLKETDGDSLTCNFMSRRDDAYRVECRQLTDQYEPYCLGEEQRDAWYERMISLAARAPETVDMAIWDIQARFDEGSSQSDEYMDLSLFKHSLAEELYEFAICYRGDVRVIDQFRVASICGADGIKSLAHKKYMSECGINSL